MGSSTRGSSLILHEYKILCKISHKLPSMGTFQTTTMLHLSSPLVCLWTCSLLNRIRQMDVRFVLLLPHSRSQPFATVIARRRGYRTRSPTKNTRELLLFYLISRFRKVLVLLRDSFPQVEGFAASHCDWFIRNFIDYRLQCQRRPQRVG